MSPDPGPLALLSSRSGGLPEQLAGRVDGHLARFAEHMREGLLAASTAVGLEVMAELMAAEVTDLAGPKGRHNRERTAKCHGHEAGTVTLSGQRVPVRRPRVRSVGDDEHEVAFTRSPWSPMTRSRPPTCSPTGSSRGCSLGSRRVSAPVPPDPARASGRWSRSTLWDILHNPKYTGYQVWNRKRRKGDKRPNPPELWVWSEEPSHEALVSREDFDAVQRRAVINEASRKSRSAPTNGHPKQRAHNTYLYRGLVRCGICGLRMWGKQRRQSSRYYACQGSHQRTANIPADHPPSVYLGERALHDGVVRFLSEAVFGPDRIAYWRQALQAAEAEPAFVPARERALELCADIADLERRLQRQILALESDDATPALRKRVMQRVTGLESVLAERGQALQRLAAHTPTLATEPDRVAAALQALPILAERLGELPQDEMRALLESLQFQTTYDPQERALMIEITLADSGQTHDDVSQVWSVPPAGVGSDLRPRNAHGTLVTFVGRCLLE